MKSLFLIDRGAPPENFTPSPIYRRVIVSDGSRVARRVAGDTAEGCSVWQNFGTRNKNKGLLLIRYRGLDVDYGVELRRSILPGGTPSGFHHRDNRETWELFRGATWWSSAKLPTWLAKLGVLSPQDEHAPTALAVAIAEDEAAASPKDTGNRPFGFRAVPLWSALASSPAFREAWLPGIELAEA